MSIDLDWETLTAGPDGLELAHRIRDFIHAKFQTVPLPRFIKSVTVHEFEFGSIPPELELKDITDPLPDFYEENPDIDDDDDDGEDDDDDDDQEVQDEYEGRGLGIGGHRSAAEDSIGGNSAQERIRHRHGGAHLPPRINTTDGLRNYSARPVPAATSAAAAAPTAASASAAAAGQSADLGSPFLGVSTPGIPGGGFNLHYFHSQFATGLSGTHTPLAAVASAQHLGSQGPTGSPVPELRQRYPPPPPSPGDGYASYGAGSSVLGHSRNASQSSNSVTDFGQTTAAATTTTTKRLSPTYPAGTHPRLKEKHSVSTLAPTSASGTRPPTRDATGLAGLSFGDRGLDGGYYDDDDAADADGSGGRRSGGRGRDREKERGDGQDRGVTPGGRREGEGAEGSRRFREPRVEDMQAVFRIRYAGDVKLLLTADILLDYPMPSFVGIPVQLSVTGLTFDGVGVVAYIRKRVHFCFLSPEDAQIAVGSEGGPTGEGGGVASSGHGAGTKVGSLLQEIRVESEIGLRESGKQSLKNVGKVERFVLEQVTRIFEEEFVYPSFWTFLV